jgi:hypothetical protein
LETFFLVEDLHAHSVFSFQDLLRTPLPLPGWRQAGPEGDYLPHLRYRAHLKLPAAFEITRRI